MENEQSGSERVPSANEITFLGNVLLGEQQNDIQSLFEIFHNRGATGEAREALFKSELFRKFLVKFIKERPLTGAPMSVDVQVSRPVLEKMFERIEAGFDKIGTAEPYWAVLTHDKFLAANVDRYKAEFFES